MKPCGKFNGGAVRVVVFLGANGGTHPGSLPRGEGKEDLRPRRFDVSRAGGEGMTSGGDRYQGFREMSLFVNQVRWRKSVSIIKL